MMLKRTVPHAVPRIMFACLEDARNALNLNGQLEIAGRTIKVSAVTDQTGMQDAGVNAADDEPRLGTECTFLSTSHVEVGSQWQCVMVCILWLIIAFLIHLVSLTFVSFICNVPGSLATPVVNSTGLTIPTAPILGVAPAVSPLLAPLVQGSVPTVAGHPGTGLQLPSPTIPSIETIGIPSECLLLKNMFDPKLETEPEFDLDIKEDVQDECSKFGKLKHIYVDR